MKRMEKMFSVRDGVCSLTSTYVKCIMNTLNKCKRQVLYEREKSS